jgi:hypothetical protein
LFDDFPKTVEMRQKESPLTLSAPVAIANFWGSGWLHPFLVEIIQPFNIAMV